MSEDNAEVEPGESGDPGEQELAPGEQEQHVEQSDEVTQFNDPNSDYWKQRATAIGWQEDFEADPDAGKFQKTPREFVNDGKFITRLSNLQAGQDRMEAEFKRNTDTQLSMQKSAHQAQIDELIIKRDESIEEADKEVANNYQEKIDNLRESAPQETSQGTPYSPAADPIVSSYEARNVWLKDMNDPTAPNYAKAKYADAVFSKAIMNGTPSQDAIMVMDKAVREQFPASNSNRQRAPHSEGSQRPAGRQTQALTYDQLSRGEQNDIDKAVEHGMFTRAEAVKKINGYRNEAK